MKSDGFPIVKPKLDSCDYETVTPIGNVAKVKENLCNHFWESL
jgi:hypothetical protein